MPAPTLTRFDVDGRPDGLVLMLHGGTQHSLAPVDERSLSWRRSAWMARQVQERAHQAGVSLWLLRYSQRGWNDGAGSPPPPVVDARWALERVRRELPDVPVVLLGHSMGARTAVAAADDAAVVGVVALAPWLTADDPVTSLRGKHLAAAHGRRDKVTSFHATKEFVRRAREVATSAELADMGNAGHYMFRRLPAWNAFAVGRALGFLRPGDAVGRGQ